MSQKSDNNGGVGHGSQLKKGPAKRNGKKTFLPSFLPMLVSLNLVAFGHALVLRRSTKLIGMKSWCGVLSRESEGSAMA
jgi:hypothetical protein